MQDSDSRPINNRLLALRPPRVETRRLITEKLHGAATSTPTREPQARRRPPEARTSVR
jgi:hypothetical protein